MRQPSRARARAAAVSSLGCAVLLFGSAPAPAGEGGRFVAGSGDAVADIGRVVARASGLPLATTFGRAFAHYQGTTARGEAAALDLGILGVMLTTPTGCGRAPLSPDQLPKPTVADSGNGAPSASRDTAGGGAIGAGREEASARPAARGDAAFTSAALAIGELLASGEGRSSSTTELVDGEERRASASVRFGSVDLAGGAVSLRGVRWAAEHRTGAGGTVLDADGTFGVDSVVVAGLPLPTGTPLELAAAFAAANAVLAPFGLRIEPPQVTKTSGDREVRVTPLRVVLGDGTAARPLLGPAMSGVQPAREALLQAMQRFRRGECDPGAATGVGFTFVDIVAAAMQGAGGIDLELGGVLATTEGVDYGDPLGLIPPGLPTVAPVAAPASRPRPPASESTFEDGPGPWPAPDLPMPGPPPPTTGPPPPEPAAATESAASPGPVTVLPAIRHCESTSRGRVAGCSNGAPLPASAAALGAALLLFGGDWWRTRRRAARPGNQPSEVQP